MKGIVIEVISCSDKDSWYSDVIGEKFVCIEFQNVYSFSPFLYFFKHDCKVCKEGEDGLVPYLFYNSLS